MLHQKLRQNRFKYSSTGVGGPGCATQAADRGTEFATRHSRVSMKRRLFVKKVAKL